MRIIFSIFVVFNSLATMAEEAGRCYVYRQDFTEKYALSRGSSYSNSKVYWQTFSNQSEAVAELQKLQNEKICPQSNDPNLYTCTIVHHDDQFTDVVGIPDDDVLENRIWMFSAKTGDDQITSYVKDLKQLGQCKLVFEKPGIQPIHQKL